jgi:hypothetical protein
VANGRFDVTDHLVVRDIFDTSSMDPPDSLRDHTQFAEVLLGNKRREVLYPTNIQAFKEGKRGLVDLASHDQGADPVMEAAGQELPQIRIVGVQPINLVRQPHGHAMSRRHQVVSVSECADAARSPFRARIRRSLSTDEDAGSDFQLGAKSVENLEAVQRAESLGVVHQQGGTIACLLERHIGGHVYAGDWLPWTRLADLSATGPPIVAQFGQGPAKLPWIDPVPSSLPGTVLQPFDRPGWPIPKRLPEASYDATEFLVC